jgi:hypothetical protein
VQLQTVPLTLHDEEQVGGEEAHGDMSPR